MADGIYFGVKRVKLCKTEADNLKHSNTVYSKQITILDGGIWREIIKFSTELLPYGKRFSYLTRNLFLYVQVQILESVAPHDQQVAKTNYIIFHI